MKTLILAAIRCSLMFTAVTASLFSVRSAQAYTVTLKEVGSNVVANGSGAINLTGLTGTGLDFLNLMGVSAISGDIFTGPNGGSLIDLYIGFTGPTSFGNGSRVFSSTGSGDVVGIQNRFGKLLAVPHGYVSGAALNGRSAVHQQIKFGAEHEYSAVLLKIAQSVTQYGGNKASFG